MALFSAALPAERLCSAGEAAENSAAGRIASSRLRSAGSLATSYCEECKIRYIPKNGEDKNRLNSKWNSES